MVQWREIGSRAAAGRSRRGLFTTPLLPDDLLGTLNPSGPPASRRQVVGLRRETADTTTLLLRTGSAPAGAPPRPVRRGRHPARGRLALAHVLGDLAAGRPAARRSPSPPMPGGTVSGALAHDTPVGTVLRLGPPAGEFVLPEPVPEKLLFLTAGSGITPVMGMLRHLAAAVPEALAGAVAVHCDRTAADVVFGAELRVLAVRDRAAPGGAAHRPATAGSPRTRWPTSCPTGPSGRPGPAARPACSTTCGDWWARHGDPDALHVERFVAPRPTGRPSAPAVGSRFTRSRHRGRRRPRRQPLMAAGEAAGALLPNGCRMGICHTCVGRCVSGAVTQPAHRRAQRHPRGTGADVCVGCRRRRRDRALGEHAVATLTADHLTDEQIEALGGELDALRAEVVASLGERRRPLHPQGHQDAARPGGRPRARCCSSRCSRRRGCRARRRCPWPRSWRTWSSGHNIMHGQWDWMRDPKIHSTTWEWDHASAAEGWKKSHNFEHHTFTNVLGKDRDLGYSMMRILPDQEWQPAYLLQPRDEPAPGAVLRVGRGVLRPRAGDGQRRHEAVVEGQGAS